MSFASSLSVSSLIGANGFQLNGATAGDNAGFSVSGAGDYNGDGYADVIIGAPKSGATDAGAFYVAYGGSAFGTGTYSLAFLPNGFSLSGGGGQLGTAVSGGGDFNGDGYDDVIVGGPGANSDRGTAAVVFGGTAGFTAAPGTFFGINGGTAGDKMGTAVAIAGDVNRDGFADIILGAPGADNGGTNSGSAYVIFGRPAGTPSTFDPSILNGKNGFRVDGAGSNAGLGSTVSSAGDVNGDGFADIIIGGGNKQSYVVFGKAEGFDAVINVSELDGSNGFRLFSRASPDDVGASLASAGDVNGDGITDLLIGRVSTFLDGAFVVFGKTTGWASSLELCAMDAGTGFRLLGDFSASPIAGVAVDGVGDINADGFADLIVSELAGSPGAYTGAGSAYVVLGKSGWSSSQNLSTLADGTNGFKINGRSSGNDILGFSVAGAGDVDGDGFADLVLGAPGSPTSEGAGYAAVVLSPITQSSFYNGTTLGDTITGSAGNDTINGLDGDDVLNGQAGRNFINGGDGDDIISNLTTSSAGGTLNGNAGIDTLDYSKATLGIASFLGDLSSGLIVSVGGGTSNDSISSFENIIGTKFADNLVGSSADNVIEGGDGNDTLNGGGGNDTASYASAASAVIVDLRFQGFAQFQNTQGAGRDVLNSFESLRGSRFDDLLVGTTGNNTIEGGAGNDDLVGGGGRDTLSYEHATNSVFLDLNGPLTQNTSGAGTDTFGAEGSTSFVNIIGSAWDDQLSGDEGINQLEGGRGDDTLSGAGTGAPGDDYDTLIGGMGDDTLIYVDGETLADGGSGFDTLEIFDPNSADATLDVTVGIFGRYKDIERVLFTGSNNKLELNALTVLTFSSTTDTLVLDDSPDGEPNSFSFLDNGWTKGDEANGYITYNHTSGAIVRASDLLTQPSFDPPLPTIISLAISDDTAPDGVVNDDFAQDFITRVTTQTITGELSEALEAGERVVVVVTNGGAADGVDATIAVGETKWTAVIDLLPGEGTIGARVVDGNEVAGEIYDQDYVLDLTAPGVGGGADFAPPTVTALDGKNGFTINGPTNSVLEVGYVVAGAGDVNADGFADVLLTSQYTDFDGENGGSAYVVFGSSGGNSQINLSELDGTNGFRLDGPPGGAIGSDSFIKELGDINYDGFSDLLVPVFGAGLYVVYGSSGAWDASLSLSTMDQSQGFLITNTSEDSSNDFGQVATSLGDVNGDMLNDILLTDYNHGDGGDGIAYVIYGNENGFAATIDVSLLGSDEVRVIFAPQPSAGFGYSADIVSDVNKDGLGDILILDLAVGEGAVVPTAYLFLGRSDVGAVSAEPTFAITLPRAAPDFFADVAGIGDVNGDGYGDVIIGVGGAYVNENDELPSGAAYVIFGGSDLGGSGLTDVSQLDGTNGFVIYGASEFDGLGEVVSAAGDVNGDGVDDLLIGASGAFSGGGGAYALYGRREGFTPSIDLAALQESEGFALLGAGFNDMIGVAVAAAGDFNGDGGTDIIVGASGANGADGAAYVIYGAVPGGAPITIGDLAFADDSGASKTDFITNQDETDLTGTLSAELGEGEFLVLSLDDGATWRDITDDVRGTSFSTDLDDVTSNTLRIKVTDIAGNDSKVVSQAFVIDEISPDAPVITGVTDDTGTPDDNITGDRNIFINGTAEAGATVTLFLENPEEESEKLGEVTADQDGKWSYDYTAVTLESGKYSFFALATDVAGNESDESDVFQVTINSLPEGNVFLTLQAPGTLLASNDITDADGLGTITYQWQRLVGATWTDLQGVTGATLTPGADLANQELRAQARFTDNGGTNETLASSVTALFGTAGRDNLEGSPGTNIIVGLAGSDALIGGEGNDTLYGGAGNDTYFVADTLSTLVELRNEGIDQVDTKVDWTLADNFENLFFSGDVLASGRDNPVGGADFTGIGNALANRIWGGNGNDLLQGLGGRDSIYGGAGDDTIDGGGDSNVLNGGDGFDMVDYSLLIQGVGVNLVAATAVLGGRVLDTFSGFEGAFGGSGNDSFVGTGGANLFIGNNGADVLRGFGGDDTLQGGEGNDQLMGGRGADLLTGGNGEDFFIFIAEDFERGIYDVVTDLNAGGVLDWFAVSGVVRETLLTVEWEGGVVVTTPEIGFGLDGGGFYIANATLDDFWARVYSF